MLAAVLRDFDHLALEDLPVPNPGAEEVVVRIRSCGFCATDYKAIKGIRRNVTFPAIVAEDPKQRVYEILPEGPDVIVEAAGPIKAVRLMVDLRRRGTRWNVFGITTHEKFELDGGLTHFLEGRMDASFGTTPLAMLKAIRLMETGLVDPEKTVSHRFPLTEIHQAVDTMAATDRGKVVVHP